MKTDKFHIYLVDRENRRLIKKVSEQSVTLQDWKPFDIFEARALEQHLGYPCPATGYVWRSGLIHRHNSNWFNYYEDERRPGAPIYIVISDLWNGRLDGLPE